MLAVRERWMLLEQVSVFLGGQMVFVQGVSDDVLGLFVARPEVEDDDVCHLNFGGSPFDVDPGQKITFRLQREQNQESEALCPR